MKMAEDLAPSMNITLSPEFERLVNEKLKAGEYRSADEVVNAALRLFKERDEDRAVIARVNLGEPLPADRFDTRLEMLLTEAEESGEAVDLTELDWEDIRRSSTARVKNRKSP